jgi:hypothetical protein
LLPPRYESKLYEWQALCHVASVLSHPVFTNVRDSASAGPLLQSREVDGVIEANGKRILIEAKSFALSHQDVIDIERKYRPLEFDELLIVAPSVSSAVPRSGRTKLLEFEPDLKHLSDGYARTDFELPSALKNELETGDHHFRFLLAERNKGETGRFRNQIDKGIRTYPQLLREIRREGPSGLPVRVFWSASRWAYPKELFFSSYSNHLLRRGLVFDIDGKAIHYPSLPCRINPGDKVCLLCIRAAKTKAIDLLNLLDGYRTSVVFSGRQGFHVYVLGEAMSDSSVRRLTTMALDAGIPVDENVARNAKSVVTMPGSIHGLSMLRAVPVDDVRTVEVGSLLAAAF